VPDCHIIGVLDNGVDGLTPSALDLIRNADLLVGNDRTLRLFASEIKADCSSRDLSEGFGKIPVWVGEALTKGQQAVVLTTGDPLCHGIARFLISKLGHGQCRVIPNTSLIQQAFARLGLPWQDARICSIHGKDVGEWRSDAGPDHGLYPLLQQIRKQQLLAIFTGPANSPGRIARMLDAVSLAYEYEMAVAERLLLPDEQVTDFLPAGEIKDRQFADPNVVILRPRNAQPAPVLFGLADDAYRQRKPERGLITKREVRAVSLARLQLRRDSIVWDIGAGSGSVGMEAARLCPDGFVFAIEKNSADAAIIRQNQQQFRLTNYRLTEDKAPQGLDRWPDPDAIFIGGSGGELEQLIDIALERLSIDGRLVMNFTTLENMNQAITQLKALGARWELCQIQVNRNKPILDMQRLQPQTPVWIIAAQRSIESNER
jgi:precorrin-6Y C5,15-methyltransferase (decarboxylating)